MKDGFRRVCAAFVAAVLVSALGCSDPMDGVRFACDPAGPETCAAGWKCQPADEIYRSLYQGICLPEDAVVPMVKVPNGTFRMGCNEEKDSSCSCPDSDECPSHNVNVPGFFIDQYEVTVAAYRACVDQGRCETPSGHGECNWGVSGRGQHPVNCIDWYQARVFCTWAGKRLCSESEWEKAARGTDGRVYPWGDEDPLSAQTKYGGPVGNFADDTAKTVHTSWTVITGYDDWYADTAPAGQFEKGASPYGALDLSGNVWEWVEDCYQSTYDSGAPLDGKARTACTTHDGAARVIRGGGFDYYAVDLRASNRVDDGPDDDVVFIGARCCRSLP